MTRPRRLVLVAGTATDIGKTWVGGQVLSRLHAAGTTVAARKPAQSAEADDPGPSDAAVLAAATGEPLDAVCPPHRSYTVAMAPPMAAEALGLPVPTLAELTAELTWPDGPARDVGWVETVGGPRSPIGSDGDAVALAGTLDPDLVVLVADAGLGTVNSVRLGADVFAPRPVVVFLNRYDPADDLHRRNLDWLRTRERLEVVVDLEALSSRVAGGPATA
ncbi:ATP-dependent dethiobiotin synthetase BioD [Aquihabitans daechungensis]|uniref:ATP-dependent dethiobiotin synthetase BioD n=1 Tax=Aquihabitans daechungensis TaxID=1052257 RepID=UPI003B9DDBBE